MNPTEKFIAIAKELAGTDESLLRILEQAERIHRIGERTRKSRAKADKKAAT